MRYFLIAAAAAGSLAAAPALAQTDHPAHRPAAPAAKAPETKADVGPTHEMCKAVMGKKMDPKAVHEHSRDQSGITAWPNGKPPSKAEMDKMHKACAEGLAAAGR